MLINTERLIIRDFQHKDKENLMKIIWQKDVIRFMKDWSENSTVKGRLSGYIDWLQAEKDSKDIYENKRYAVTLKETDELIGMVGMGLEDTLNEVEMAYFIDEDHVGNGYATEALRALYEWCISVSDIPYMILTIDCENIASCKVAEKAQFKLFEKRTPIGHKQPNMESDSYFYYRKYR
ncbi:GNAT family N-acetyltransferase [Clostridium beijerinckii]|uniref:GNAT family N-acetyltransferase n=1 Tax=Clostridium beijerinckii TaxID=1520 RepID=A0AAW3WDP8_CLOBE|nr:GNAT family N-acetyltransferase [Clostridium beijerinckii]MBC2459627.1 GNAT family N-acetyltransferase [Clostridium beijerinckii]MBC2477100.1 GNAT family N-acetyltransferase [Clostridium beijerinckii]NOV61087.1 RimJ/RimL family protein N-acetyltransferase [Clostridium beijerinckii]NOV69420.1 RimJ/RimL family protein N-acetyltransferase [Clostridium beijerinckii]NOW33050.1 RimJ/RimL family protein N-acetyltransferase [Clostridium beijerinckii]